MATVLSDHRSKDSSMSFSRSVDLPKHAASTTIMASNVHHASNSGPKHLSKFNIFYALSFTTTIACLLVAANELEWRQSGELYLLVTSNRASAQIFIQVLANLLGLIHVTAICRLINYTTRIRFSKSPVSLGTLQAWIALSAARMDWNLPTVWLILLALLTATTLVPSALWAGAITPVLTTTVIQGSLLVPSYRNVSLIKQYPAEPSSPDASPFVRNAQGLFTYQVGMQFAGNILSSAANANGLNNLSHPHAKFDNTRYTYFGRSYGVGATVGLGDLAITGNPLATQYTYQEVGYSTQVSCIYNMSNAMSIGKESTYLYGVTGYLPDSPPSSPEYVNYVGTDEKAIVALSVSTNEPSPRRYLAIVAGSSYDFLNATQCTIDYTPMLFNISVAIAGQNISVVPDVQIADFDPKRNLTRTVMTHFSAVSAIETNFYLSQVGNALNSSIAGWKLSHPGASDDEATLAGLEQAFLAMADDILVGFGSAQYVVGNFSETVASLVRVNALRFGTAVYIYAIFVINALVVLAFVIEALRTHVWRELVNFDYLDSRALVVAGSMGGRGIADAASQTAKSADGDLGRMLVRLQQRDDIVAIQYAGTAREFAADVKPMKYSRLMSYDHGSFDDRLNHSTDIEVIPIGEGKR